MRPPKTPFEFPPLAELRPDAIPILRGDETTIDLSGYWLSVNCCQHTDVPFRLLCAQIGWSVPLTDVLRCLKCKKCGGPPKSIEIVANPAHGAPGHGGEERVALRLR